MHTIRVLVCQAIAVSAAAVVFAQGPTSPPQSTAAPPNPESVKKAEQVLTEARKALGGDKLAELKTLIASGRTKRVRGNNLVPIEFEILIELPNKYVRVDEYPAEDTDPTSAGFNGDALIQIPPPAAMPVAAGRAGAAPAGAPATPPAAATPAQAPPPAAPGRGVAGPPGAVAPGDPAAASRMGGGRGPMMDPRRARLNSLKQDYARLTLGLFAASTAFPLTFSYAAVAEAPQG